MRVRTGSLQRTEPLLPLCAFGEGIDFQILDRPEIDCAAGSKLTIDQLLPGFDLLPPSALEGETLRLTGIWLVVAKKIDPELARSLFDSNLSFQSGSIFG